MRIYVKIVTTMKLRVDGNSELTDSCPADRWLPEKDTMEFGLHDMTGFSEKFAETQNEKLFTETEYNFQKKF